VTLALQKRTALQAFFSRKSHLAKENRFSHLETAPISRLLTSKERFGDIVRNKTKTTKATIATGMKKALSYAETKVKQSEKVASLRRKLRQDSQTNEMEQLEVEVETETANRTHYTKQQSWYTPEPKPTAQAFETRSNNPTLTPEQKVSQETPTECLTCEKLVHCDLRSGMTAKLAAHGSDGAPCRFVAELTQQKD
jgi:Zn-dependent metalloprotease